MRGLWGIGVFIGISLVVAQPRVEAVIVINEVLADPPAVGGDANGDGVTSATQDEFVELVNTGADPVVLANWTLADAVQVRHVFSSTAAIPSYGIFTVFGGGSPQGFTNVAVASSGGLSLNNSGDTVTLRDAHAVLIDRFIYGAEGGRDVSLTRSPDGTGAFVPHASASRLAFSPGATVDGRSTLPAPSSDPPIPEPSSLALLSVGACSLSLIRRRAR